MKRAPQLGGDENLLPVDPGSLDALSDLFLVLVHESTVDMPVTALEGRLDGLGDFPGTGLP